MFLEYLLSTKQTSQSRPPPSPSSLRKLLNFVLRVEPLSSISFPTLILPQRKVYAFVNYWYTIGEELFSVDIESRTRKNGFNLLPPRPHISIRNIRKKLNLYNYGKVCLWKLWVGWRYWGRGRKTTSHEYFNWSSYILQWLGLHNLCDPFQLNNVMILLGKFIWQIDKKQCINHLTFQYGIPSSSNIKLLYISSSLQMLSRFVGNVAPILIPNSPSPKHRMIAVK